MNSYDRLWNLLVYCFHNFVASFFFFAYSLVVKAFGSLVEEWVPTSIDITQFIPEWISPWRKAHRDARSMATAERAPSRRGAPDDEHATLAKDAAASIGRGDTRKTVLIKCPPERHIAVEFHEIGKELVRRRSCRMLHAVSWSAVLSPRRTGPCVCDAVFWA